MVAEITRRLSRLNVTAATLIWVLTAAALWGQWRSVGLVLGAQFLLVPFNLFVNLVVLFLVGVWVALIA